MRPRLYARPGILPARLRYLGISVTDLSHTISYTRTMTSGYANGRYSVPLHIAEHIADHVGLDVDVLFITTASDNQTGFATAIAGT